MLSLSFSESTGSIYPLRVRVGGFDPKFMERIKLLREKLNRCSRCHFRNLRGRFPPYGFVRAELTPSYWKNEGFWSQNLINALVVIFGSYGVDFPPKGSQKWSWLRIRWKNEGFGAEILIEALDVIFGIYGVDFPPQGSYERSWLRTHWKVKVCEAKV